MSGARPAGGPVRGACVPVGKLRKDLLMEEMRSMVDRSPGTRLMENLLRPVLIAAMMVCLAAPFVTLGEWGLSGWDGTYFMVFCFLAGLEGILSERALRRRRISGWEYLGSRGAESLILLLLLKLANYVPLGVGQLWSEAQNWLTNPGSFLKPVDILTMFILLPLWAGALLVGRQASELDTDEHIAPAPADKTSAEYYLWLTQPPPVSLRQEALDTLSELFLWGGIGLLITSTALHFLLPMAMVSVLPMLLYFTLGIALLSQARFSVTRAGWQIQGIPVQPGIGRRWLVWAVIFLVGIALVALALPTEYTMGPLLTLLYFLGLIAQTVLAIITLIPYLLALLASLFFPSVEQPVRPTTPLELMPPPEPTGATATPPWVEVLISAFFWTLILAIVGYALIRFFRERWGFFANGDHEQGAWQTRLLAWLRSLRAWWRRRRRVLQDGLARRRAGRAEAQSVASRLAPLLSLRRLPPRELVRYFYLSAARRAAQVGQPRQPGQTPYEYQASLDQRFPDLEPDLTGLTDAFIEARYSSRLVSKKDADAVKPLWQRIKQGLRRRRTDG